MSDRPNFVLVMPDQQRMDSLGCYGNVFTRTPHVDRLAAAGTRLDSAFCAWPVCTPSRASMWTGAYPSAHGIIDNVYGIDNAFATIGRIRTTLFDGLGEAGYHRAHFGKWHLGEAKPPFFDVWEECFNSRQGHWVDGKKDGTYRPDVQTDAMVAFFERQGESRQPFIAVQGYYPPHDPFTAPARFYAPYRGKGVPFAGYYAAVSALDHCTGRIVEALERTGLRRNTIVIYYADHGETFLYRKDGEHKFVCHEEAIRIPFILSCPGLVPEGAVIQEPVSLVDLMPTILDYAGLPASAPAHGRSLRPLLEGRKPADWPDDVYVQNITHGSGTEQRCLRTATKKLIASAAGAHELYDLEDDPEEELDIFTTPRPDPGFERYRHIPDQAPIIADLAKRMRARAEAIGDARGVALAADVETAIGERMRQPRGSQ